MGREQIGRAKNTSWEVIIDNKERPASLGNALGLAPALYVLSGSLCHVKGGVVFDEL